MGTTAPLTSCLQTCIGSFSVCSTAQRKDAKSDSGAGVYKHVSGDFPIAALRDVKKKI